MVSQYATLVNRDQCQLPACLQQLHDIQDWGAASEHASVTVAIWVVAASIWELPEPSMGAPPSSRRRSWSAQERPTHHIVKSLVTDPRYQT